MISHGSVNEGALIAGDAACCVIALNIAGTRRIASTELFSRHAFFLSGDSKTSLYTSVENFLELTTARQEDMKSNLINKRKI
jgi:hypothetical protein